YNTGEHNSYSKPYRATYDLSEDYHTYALEWNPDELIYYFDNKEIARYKNENATSPLFIYLSSAVLSWAGSVAGEEADGSAQIVDYVRVWQRPADAQNEELTIFNKPVTAATLDGVKSVSIAGQKVDNEPKEDEIVIAPTKYEGTWKESTAIENYNQKSHLYVQEKGAYAEFALDGIESGKYKVYYWRMPHVNNKTQEDIHLVKSDGTEEVIGSVALKLSEGQTAEPGWILVNEVELNPDDILQVRCTGLTTRVSGIKLVPVK
ncbi:MAG: family 16 glycosylhydrolase, partial [Clostridia bacterium]|nr:family 16 glycosylhydrolase [Clostridia bacterium]